MISIIKFIALVIITFFMCRIITNKRTGLAVLGTLLICFSTAVLEYLEAGLVEALLYGQGAVIFVNEFFNNKTKFKYATLIGVMFASAGFLVYSNLTWQLSIGSVMLALLVWIILKYKKEINIKEFSFLILTIIVSVTISMFFYKYSVMNRNENGQIIYYLTSYFYSYILPFNKEIKFVTHEALTCMISVFPMPLVIALLYMYKNEKHSEFILPIVFVTIAQIVGAVWISKIVPPYIMAISVALAQIYIMIYFFANVKEKVFSLKTAIYITLGYLVFVALMTVPKAVSTRLMLFFMGIGTTLECFAVCKYEDMRYQKIAPIVYGIFTLIGFIAYIVM